MDTNARRAHMMQPPAGCRCAAAARALFLSIAVLACAVNGSCTLHSPEDRAEKAAAKSIGNERHGRELADRFGCGTCHTIPGIQRADGRVGPPLDGIAKRVYVGGALPNTPPNMIRWLQHPQNVNPATAMPDVGLNDNEARDIAAYLYTLK